jgi:predicted transcriptional regulator
MFKLPKIDPEFKGLIPPLSPDERKQLEENLLSVRKCHNALILWNGLIIDGHNRFEICAKHGISFEIKEMDFASREDAKVWILENQLGRRNLNDAARIEIALAKAELLREKAKNNQILNGGDKSRAGANSSKATTRENVRVSKSVANEAGISEGTLHNYMQIKKAAGPELLEKVKSGEVKIGTAHRMLGREIIKRLKNADKMYKFLKKHIPFENNDEANSKIFAELGELREILRGVISELETKRKGA